MKIRKEYILLVAIILSLSAYIFLRKPDRTHYQLPKLSEIAVKNITKIEIKGPDGTVILKKKDRSWNIDPKGYPADAAMIKNMLDIADKLTITALVSESKNYERYDLNDEMKITVKALAGNTPVRTFEVGKAAGSYRHTFIKLAGDDRVYHARGNFRGKFDKTVDELRDKTVLSFDQKQIQEIHITKDDQVVAFTCKDVPVKTVPEKKKNVEGSSPASKTNKVWQTADGKKVDGSKLKNLIRTLSKLRCDNYIEGKKKDGFSNPIYSVRLKGAKEYFLSIFNKTAKGAKGHPAISSENIYPFFLSDWKAKDIMKTPEELLEKKKPDKMAKSVAPIY